MTSRLDDRIRTMMQEVVEQAPQPPDLPTGPRLVPAPAWRAANWAVAFAAAVAVFVLVGGVVWLIGGNSAGTIEEPMPTTTVAPEQSELDPVIAEARAGGALFDFSAYDLCDWFTSDEIRGFVVDAYALRGVDTPVPGSMSAQTIGPNQSHGAGCVWIAPTGSGGDTLRVSLQDETEAARASGMLADVVETGPDTSEGDVVVFGEADRLYTYVDSALIAVGFDHVVSSGAALDADETEGIEFAILMALFEGMNWVAPIDWSFLEADAAEPAARPTNAVALELAAGTGEFEARQILDADLATDVWVGDDGVVWAILEGASSRESDGRFMGSGSWSLVRSTGDGWEPLANVDGPPMPPDMREVFQVESPSLDIVGVRHDGGVWVHEEPWGPEGPFFLWELWGGEWIDHTSESGLPGRERSVSMNCCDIKMDPNGTVLVQTEGPEMGFRLRRYDGAWADVDLPTYEPTAIEDYYGFDAIAPLDDAVWIVEGAAHPFGDGAMEPNRFGRLVNGEWMQDADPRSAPHLEELLNVGQGAVLSRDGAIWTFWSYFDDPYSESTVQDTWTRWTQESGETEFRLDREGLAEHATCGFREFNPKSTIAPDGALWTAWPCIGVVRIDPHEESMTLIQKDLPSADAHRIHITRDGTVWVAGAGGITQITPTP